MRLDMGVRAKSIVDNRAAAATEPKHIEEYFARLTRFAL